MLWQSGQMSLQQASTVSFPSGKSMRMPGDLEAFCREGKGGGRLSGPESRTWPENCAPRRGQNAARAFADTRGALLPPRADSGPSRTAPGVPQTGFDPATCWSRRKNASAATVKKAFTLLLRPFLANLPFHALMGRVWWAFVAPAAGEAVPSRLKVL
jgi:hypothetical protein